MGRLEGDYSEKEINQLREAMEQLRQSQLDSKQRVRQVYEEMKRRDPEFWKASGFANERDYLVFVGWTELINPDL